MPKTQVILVGGFLGAGKTTLLARATEQLVRQGKRVGLITNDLSVGVRFERLAERAAGEDVGGRRQLRFRRCGPIGLRSRSACLADSAVRSTGEGSESAGELLAQHLRTCSS